MAKRYGSRCRPLSASQARQRSTVPTAIGLASEAALHECRGFAPPLPFTFHSLNPWVLARLCARLFAPSFAASRPFRDPPLFLPSSRSSPSIFRRRDGRQRGGA